MTLDVCADFFDHDLNAVSDRLDEAYERSVVGKMWAEPVLSASETEKKPRHPKDPEAISKRGDGGI